MIIRTSCVWHASDYLTSDAFAVSQPEKEEAKQGASTEPSAISQPVTQPEALVASQPAVSIHPEQPPQPSRPETSRFQHVFAENAATQPPQV